MAGKPHDDLADALSAMASGEVPAEETQGETIPPVAGPETSAPAPLRAATPSQPAPAASPVSRPVSPTSVRPMTPQVLPASPARPSSPVAPVVRQPAVTSTVAPATVVPKQPAPPPKLPAAPAQPISVKPGKVTSTASKFLAIEKAKQLNFKRTIIPPLLTLGALFPILGIVSLVMGDESPLGEGTALPIVLIIFGLILLGSGVMSMLQVRYQLASQPQN